MMRYRPNPPTRWLNLDSRPSVWAEERYNKLIAAGPIQLPGVRVLPPEEVRCYDRLHRALTQAFQWGLAPRNPAALVFPPASPARDDGA